MLLAYLTRNSPFDDTFWELTDQIKTHQISQNQSPNPSYLWKITGTNETFDISDLALLLFSVCPNSASCEWVFSSFDIIHTKLRNQLSAEKVTSIAKVKSYLRSRQQKPQKGKRERLDEIHYQQNQNPAEKTSSYDTDSEELIITPEDFEQEAVPWLTNLAVEGEGFNFEEKNPDSLLFIPLKELFNYHSGLAFDSSITSALSYLVEEKSFFDTLGDVLAAVSVDLGETEARDIAQAVTGGGYFIPDPVAIGAAVNVD